MTPRALGYLPDPPDTRDRPASAMLPAGAAPASSDNRELIASVLDQGSYSSCVANATMQAVRASHIHQGDLDAPLGSRLFTYYYARRGHAAETRDAGTFVRSAFNAISKLGFPREEDWPYHVPVNQAPGLETLRDAFDQRRPTEYFRIDEQGPLRVDAAKRALAAGHLIVFGTDIDASFFEVKGEIVGVPAGPIVGGHAMCVVDHSGDVFRVVNSWGTEWGMEGFWSMSADYLAWQGTRDLWLVKSAPRWS